MWYKVIVLFILCAGVRGGDERVGPANLFVARWREWAEIRNGRGASPYILSVKELAAWEQVKRAWRAAEKAMDREYRGDNLAWGTSSRR